MPPAAAVGVVLGPSPGDDSRERMPVISLSGLPLSRSPVDRRLMRLRLLAACESERLLLPCAALV